MTLDLNKPKDARRYIEQWIESGDLVVGATELSVIYEMGTDLDFLRVARELFTKCDEREALGGDH